MIAAEEAIRRLQEGNSRFAAGEQVLQELPSAHLESDGTPARQEPFAVVLGCSDSRVPSEMIFDQGLGDLFVIRVAGNIAAPSQVGSIEYAASQFGTRLVVVLGHSHCGAVTATLEQLQENPGSRSPNLQSIVGRIRPAVEPLLATTREDRGLLLQEAVRANIRASVAHLRRDSQILNQLQREGLVITGAEYSLETRKVEFLQNV